MLALFFDTETTGIVNWKAPAISPVQPNLVQLGALLIDLDDRSEVASLDVIVTPEGKFEIPDGAAAVHKITTAKAEKCGILLEHAVLPFRDMLAAADLVVAHNTRFDKIIMERASAMVDINYGVDVQDLWLPKNKLVCTMLASTPVVKKRPKSGRVANSQDYAWPKLFEALKFFTGEDLENAHNAMVDVRACVKIFFALVDKHDAFRAELYDEVSA